MSRTRTKIWTMSRTRTKIWTMSRRKTRTNWENKTYTLFKTIWTVKIQFFTIKKLCFSSVFFFRKRSKIIITVFPIHISFQIQQYTVGGSLFSQIKNWHIAKIAFEIGFPNTGCRCIKMQYKILNIFIHTYPLTYFKKKKQNYLIWLALILKCGTNGFKY